MSAIPEKRVLAIRERIRGGRATISELNGRISADLKKFLMPASEFLSDAEGWLAPKVLQHPPRSTSEWTRWLSFVEGILGHAVAHRKRVEGLIRKHGPNARVVG